ncbi:response regulator [Acuticoccus sp. I52.16.1]|uniref:ATP-binding response regulator n=1 Tax=Acuticoccus sp. I52.16.1 TaxID=2928472 RepID=UPI001FD05DBF|nr:response regulator [Acuticoccus sp. I52.16.1]UOM34762.1 response regulator [Acuticoccus sp. I52.16.1]
MYPTDANTKLLLVEDNPADAELTAAVLEGADVTFEILTAASLGTALRLLNDEPIDAVVLDLNLPDSRGIETLRRMREQHHDVAIVVVSGANPPGLRGDVLSEGAQDFIWKNEPDSNFLARCILYAVERHRAQEAHRSVRQLLDANPDAMIVVDGGGIVRYINKAAEELLHDGSNLIGEWLGFSSGERLTEIEILTGGKPRTCEMKVAEIEWSGQRATLAAIRDVTENRLLAEQVRAAQKMEAIGVLAGGVAHDFNNLLVVIMGNLEFLREDIEDEDHQVMLSRIETATERARTLTRQLLAMSRRQPSRPVVVRPNDLIIKSYTMLRPSFPKDIELVFIPAEEIWNIRIDPSEFDQILMNLAFNAKHALPHGGRLQVDLANTTLERTVNDLTPGQYVRVQVSDNGTGIAPDHLTKIFEPFFSTKTAGTGTGLGLAICQGIARKAGGDIVVSSEIGVGSTFSVLVPRCYDAVTEIDTKPELPQIVGDETVLVVEDDAAVAGSIMQALQMRGFRTIHVDDGEKATRVLSEGGETVDIVLSDVVMPRMGGVELARWLAKHRPEMKVVLATGYADNVDALRAENNPQHEFLFKPFAPTDLIATVRMMLDR